MMRVAISVCLFALLVHQPSDIFSKYRPVESYEVEPGIFATPSYSPNDEVCEISIEKHHYSQTSVDMDAEMSKAQVLSVFADLSPEGDRGLPSGGLPAGSERTERDGGVSVTSIEYEKVSFQLFGFAAHQKEGTEKYVSAVMLLKNPDCQPQA